MAGSSYFMNTTNVSSNTESEGYLEVFFTKADCNYVDTRKVRKLWD